MKKLLIWGALLTALWFPKSAFAQGYTVNDIVLSNFGTSIGNVGKPIAGAVITVCSIGATGMPCTPTANAYTDYTLGTLIDQSTNPITSDAAGNYTFSVAVGANYVVTITGNKVKPRSYIVTAIVGASNCGTLANTEVLYGTGLATCSVSPNFTWTNSTNTFGLTQGTATWPALLITPNASASQPIFYAGSPSSQFSTAANTDLFFFSQAGGSTAPFGTPSTAALGAEFAWSVDNLASGNTGGLMSASECTTTCSTHTPVGMWAFANGNNATGTSSPFGMQIQASTSGAGAGKPVALYLQGLNYGAATDPVVTGLQILLESDELGGSITDARNIDILSDAHYFGAPVGTIEGLHIQNQGGVATTLGCAICIDDQGSVATDYAIKTGTGQVSFGDKVISTVATGTPPLTIASTTPVANLTTVPLTYNHSGTQQTATHLIQDSCVLGTSCAVTLTGSAVYTSSTSYTCSGVDDTGIFAVNVAQASGSSVTFTGNSTDTIRYTCVGN